MTPGPRSICFCPIGQAALRGEGDGIVSIRTFVQNGVFAKNAVEATEPGLPVFTAKVEDKNTVVRERAGAVAKEARRSEAWQVAAFIKGVDEKHVK